MADPFMLEISPDACLRLMTLDDAPVLYAMVEGSRANLERWLGWPARIRDTAGARTFIRRYARRWEKQASLLAGIYCEGAFAGIAVYREIDLANRSAEIGYALDDAFRGRGLATRTTRALIEYAYTTLDLHRITIVCASGNRESRAIPERLGFRHEGTARDATLLRGTFIDLEHYALLRPEWAAANGDRQSER